MAVGRWRRIPLLLILAFSSMPAWSTGCRSSTPEPAAAPPTSTPMLEPTATVTPAPSSTPTRVPTSTAQPTSTPTPTPRPRPTTPSPEQLATQYPELAALLNNPEVSAVYKELMMAYQEGGEQQALAVAQQRGLLTPEGDVRATLMMDSADTAATVAQLQSMGIKVVGAEGNRIDVAIPQQLIMAGASRPGGMLNQLSGLNGVVGVQPPM